MPAKNRLVAVLCCLVAVLLVSACAQNEDIQTVHVTFMVCKFFSYLNAESFGRWIYRHCCASDEPCNN